MAKKREASKSLRYFTEMEQSRYECLQKYGIIIKPHVSREEAKYFLELQDYRTIARFMDKGNTKEIFTYLKENNPLFIHINSWDDSAAISNLINKELKHVFEPGAYTYYEYDETKNQEALTNEV
jgi:hypothetical protein